VDPVNTSELPFVDVATGAYWGPPGGPYIAIHRKGFLTRSEGDQFTVRYLDLQQKSLERTPPDTPDLERVGLSAASLADHAAAVAACPVDPNAGPSWTFDGPVVMSDFSQRVLLARACERGGLSDAAAALLEGVTVEQARTAVSEGLREWLKLLVLEPGLSWTQVRDRHRRWIDAFPGARGRDQVEERVGVLDRMVREDEDRNALNQGDEESTEDLIFALRHANAPVKDVSEWGVGGWYFGSPDNKKGRHAVRRLLDMGFDAVPALIDAVEDDTLTRCVEAFSGGGLHIVRVGSLARPRTSA
jgi:hypothetical protein